jgi:hypothetical protein
VGDPKIIRVQRPPEPLGRRRRGSRSTCRRWGAAPWRGSPARSVCGPGSCRERNGPLGTAIVLDDAHVALSSVREAFTLTISEAAAPAALRARIAYGLLRRSWWKRVRAVAVSGPGNMRELEHAPAFTSAGSRHSVRTGRRCRSTAELWAIVTETMSNLVTDALAARFKPRLTLLITLWFASQARFLHIKSKRRIALRCHAV